MSDSHTKQKKSKQKTQEKTKDKVGFDIRTYVAKAWIKHVTYTGSERQAERTEEFN